MNDPEPPAPSRPWVQEQFRMINAALPTLTVNRRPLSGRMGPGRMSAWADPTGIRKLDVRLDDETATTHIQYFFSANGQLIFAWERGRNLVDETRTERRTWYHYGQPFLMADEGADGRTIWVQPQSARARSVSATDHRNIRQLFPLVGASYRGQ
jgi:hypothetical protein